MAERAQVIALGEVLWDLFPGRSCFGGAPANFACCVAELDKESAEVRLVSGVGADELGELARKELHQHQVGTDLIQEADRRTGQVDICLDAQGLPTYTFADQTAWDHLEWNQDLALAANTADAVCFGTLAQRTSQSADTIQRFVQSTPNDCLRVFDINLRFPHVVDFAILNSLDVCNVLKLNEDELPYLIEMLQLEADPQIAVHQLMTKFGLRLVALTLGSNGAILFTEKETVVVRSPKIEVVDTVGAGDAFTATLVLGLLNVSRQGWPISQLSADQVKQLGQQASNVAEFVCTQPGATPAFPGGICDWDAVFNLKGNE